MTILIQNGQVINPATGMNEVADVLVENGVVSKIEKGIKEKADRKINAVASTSAGRLFDAVSAILGIRRRSGFEG